MSKFTRVKIVANAPLSSLYKFGASRLRRKFFKPKKINLEKELLKENACEPKFPVSFVSSFITASKQTADKICLHEFDLLGSGVCNLGKHINWHKDFKNNYEFPQIKSEKIKYDFSGGKDIKIPWELSRFQFLPTLAKAYEIHNDEKYAVEAKNLIQDWTVKNLLGTGVNWKCAMEAAIRACNFTLAWAFLKNSEAWKNSNWQNVFLTSIIEHGKFIIGNLEYGPGFNTNHLIADAAGLLFLGIMFPNLREARKWKAKAIKLLEDEMQNQVYEDGVDFEASIGYHRFACELFGFCALLCKMNAIKLSEKFYKRLEKMFEFVFYYTKTNGLAPIIGDNDDSRLFIFEDFYSWEPRDHKHLFWLAAELFPLNKKFIQTQGLTEEKTSKFFEKSGIEIMRKNDFYCIVDAGGSGQNGNGGHCHNDTLSFELFAGEDFIIDPGSYVYTSDPFARRKFRGTAMHNTVMIDNEEINRFRKKTLFGIYEDCKPKINRFISDETRDFFDAQHNGYKRLKESVIHRRTFSFDKKSISLKITDYFSGKGNHVLKWNFHFAPAVQIKKEAEKIFAEKNYKKLEIILPKQLIGCAEIHEDEISPRYGVKEKAKTLSIKLKTNVNESSFFTFLFKTS